MATGPGDAITWGVLPDHCLDRVVVCSPHFDDAALGAAHLLLAHPGSTVVTVFAGRPARYPDPPTEWDALGGFRAGDDVVGLRREEDRAAMDALGARPVWLDFVDHQYLARDERAAPEEIAVALEASLDAARPTAVFLPMGLANPDHVSTHDAGMLLAAAPQRPHLVLLRGQRVQAHPRHARVADRQAVPLRDVADADGGAGRPRQRTQAGGDRVLPVAAAAARS